MKYYELMRSANNSVGAEFAYCTEKDLKIVKEEFQPNISVDIITEEQYKQELERQHKRGLRFATGYPK